MAGQSASSASGVVVAELSLRARSLLSLGMGRNGYVPPSSSMQPGPQHDPDYVAPGSQEHLLGAGNPSDLARNAFGHASALMAELVWAAQLRLAPGVQPTLGPLVYSIPEVARVDRASLILPVAMCCVDHATNDSIASTLISSTS